MGRGNSVSNTCMNKNGARNHHDKDIRGNTPAEGSLPADEQARNLCSCVLCRATRLPQLLLPSTYRYAGGHLRVECGLFVGDSVRSI